MHKRWSTEEDEFVVVCTNQGWTARQISQELNRSTGSVSERRKKLAVKGTVGAGKRYTKEQLIEIMKNAPVVSYDYFNSKDSGLPTATTYRSYFGSWSAALQAAGIDPAVSIMKVDRPTTVYLVSFGEFYKVGITQQTVDQRLGGRYPPYQILKTVQFETLGKAKALEACWLETVRPYKFVPSNFPVEGRGFTECFKHADPMILLGCEVTAP